MQQPVRRSSSPRHPQQPCSDGCWGKHIARKGVESSERLGRRRWVIERTMSCLTGYHGLIPGYACHPRNYLAFLGLAAAICCHERLVRLTT